MPYYKFGPTDVFHNRIKTHPKNEFVIYDGQVYYNSNPRFARINTDGTDDLLNHVPYGYVSLYELNVDRASGELIYPFITKQGSLTSFKTIATSQFNTDFAYGDQMSSTYPLSASISFSHSALDNPRDYINALQNTLDYYKINSPHYAYSSSAIPGCEKNSQKLSLISIPSIFYGSSIRKGSVRLKYYVSGTLLAELHDIGKNGELIEVTSSVHATGNVAGVVLYNEGFLILTGTWDLHEGGFVDKYHKGDTAADNQNPAWIFFANGANDTTYVTGDVFSSSYSMEFEGVNYVPTLTMLAHAPKGLLNYSSNPTYRASGSGAETAVITASMTSYSEDDKMSVKNIVTSSHDHSASFKKQTYISQIGLYDDDRNLIGIAKLATPVKKTEERDFTFKLKLDF
tara:strand:- start:1581 stop:2780 length:1200 start_codon:yes stop_codon:yes gene_type:complete